MMNASLTPHERELIEQTRKVNHVLSLYVLAIHEKKTLTADEHGAVAGALRSMADIVEQEGNHPAHPMATNNHPVSEPSIGDQPPPDGTAAEA